MFKKTSLVFCGLLICVATAITGCKSKFETLLASNNVAKKNQEAMRLYNNKNYSKALILFDDLNKKFKGQDGAEELAYYFAYTNYKLKDYLTARYLFKTYADTYPNSARTEECRYMAAYCYYMESPSLTLDQANTLKAIDALQLFINLYPKSERTAEASTLISDLRNKLETKSYLNAKLYLDIGVGDVTNYRSAVIAFRNSLRDYPDSKYGEEMEYLMIKAQYLYAKNSVETRQESRYNEVYSLYNEFVRHYPNSKFQKDADQLKKDTEAGIIQTKKYLAAQAEELKLREAKKEEKTAQ